ncbi:hypothetical protein Scep_021769 [Stephania cephalantha]|uniref:SWIM-type domain-containing protein n=1 Tax=Stephania cephalantha TaxID=152367 RepID=A0AAP0I1Q8_9MAGN
MDDLEMAKVAFIRDIFGSSDIEGSSHESLGCEDNSVPLVDEVSISNVIHEQDFNIVSRPIPTVGMSFGSVDELLETYQDHAKEKGFAVVIRSSTKDEDGQLKYVWLSCDRGRYTYFEKHSKRVNCTAKVRAIRGGDNHWLVSKVVVEHNHELVPDLSFFMRSHRELNAHMKRLLQANERACIKPSKSIRMLQIQEGGPKNLGLRLNIQFQWESQFYNAYTRNVFKKVKGEINGMMYCHLDPNNENDTSSIPSVEKFNIKECSIKNWYCKEFSYTVEYRANGQYFDCNCRKFESSGLLRRHIFEVMNMKGIARVHERYIMRRWRKDVLRRHSSIVHSGGYPQMTDEYKKFKEIERALHEAVDLHNIWVMILVFKILIMSLFEILTMFVVEGGRGRTVLDQSGKEEELEEIVVKDKVEAKAVKAKVKANQLA